MGLDADRGESVAYVGGSVHHKKHGLVLPDQGCEATVPWDADPLGLVVVEVCRRPFVLADKVIEKRSC